MEERRCAYCGRKLHPKLRKDARFCERTCKSNWHRWKKEQPERPQDPEQWFDRIPDEWKSTAYSIIGCAPSGARGYLLRKINCPHGKGSFCFPVPHRVTKHSDNTLRNTPFYRLSPFEVPRVPWTGEYELLFYMPDRGVVAPAGQTTQHIQVKHAVDRAAWDEHALWKFFPSKTSGMTGSSAEVAQQIQERAPKNALGYLLWTQNSPHGPGSFMFPLEGRATPRADGTMRDAHYFRLDPYEPPMVPWPGIYKLYFTLPDMPFWVDDDPKRQLLYVGRVHPYAEFDRKQIPPTIVIAAADLVETKRSQGPARLIAGRRGLRRLPRRRTVR